MLWAEPYRIAWDFPLRVLSTKSSCDGAFKMQTVELTEAMFIASSSLIWTLAGYDASLPEKRRQPEIVNAMQ
jgi:hypothetical protein